VKSLVAAIAAVAALALPSLAFAGSQSGVVAKIDRSSGLVAVVQSKGAVALVHAPVSALHNLRPGSRVVFDAKRLRNATSSTRAFTVTGVVRRVKVRGMVVSLDAKHSSFALSAHGAVLPLTFTKHARKLSACGCPALNSTDEVTVEFGAAGQITASAVTQVDPTADVGAFDGVVSAEAGGTLTLASTGSTITVVIPAWFDPSKLAVGDHVIAYFVRRPDGSYAIEAVANNGSADEADDPSGEQGDVENIEHQCGVDEQSGEQASSDQTAAQLALAELAADEAAIENDLHEGAQECSAHVDKLKAAGATAAELATATATCVQTLAEAQHQANQDLQDCEQEVEEQVSGDAGALQELTNAEQQLEGDLQQSEQQDAQDTQDGTFDSGSSPGDTSAGQ
jgi:hypothetical protein